MSGVVKGQTSVKHFVRGLRCIHPSDWEEWCSLRWRCLPSASRMSSRQAYAQMWSPQWQGRRRARRQQRATPCCSWARRPASPWNCGSRSPQGMANRTGTNWLWATRSLLRGKSEWEGFEYGLPFRPVFSYAPARETIKSERNFKFANILQCLHSCISFQRSKTEWRLQSM